MKLSISINTGITSRHRVDPTQSFNTPTTRENLDMLYLRIKQSIALRSMIYVEHNSSTFEQTRPSFQSLDIINHKIIPIEAINGKVKTKVTPRTSVSFLCILPDYSV
jgi:hypothetical protein